MCVCVCVCVTGRIETCIYLDDPTIWVWLEIPERSGRMVLVDLVKADRERGTGHIQDSTVVFRPITDGGSFSGLGWSVGLRASMGQVTSSNIH